MNTAPAAGPAAAAATRRSADASTTGHPPAATAGLALLALGVVFGDIGTSPLYAVRETFAPRHGIALDATGITGGIACIVWALMIVVSLKYVGLVLRADNRGEGGIMALLALALHAAGERPRLKVLLGATGVAGAALFLGDAVLTPAVSVLSAVEGLEVGTDSLDALVVPLSIGILAGLFLIQRHGTGVVGVLFGPICALWFLAIGACGAANILAGPEILAAFDPRRALAFLNTHGASSLLVLGSVLLAVTGAEALYADMGHFGRRAVRVAWTALVAPALLLNYLGQGALLLRDPQAIENPFYLAFPAWALYPMVALATAATVIASQATISGAYSMARQAIHLGYLPRMTIRHTSSTTMGQIYMPLVNWLLLGAVVLTVAGFGSSSALSSAYGLSVMGTMTTTTLLLLCVMRFGWGWPAWACVLGGGALLAVDGLFLAAAGLKIAEGGWFPLALGSVLLVVMTTWRRGRLRLLERLAESSVPLAPFIDSLMRDPPPRVPGSAVFLTSTPDTTPSSLLHSLKHYGVLHATNVFLTVEFTEQPGEAADANLDCEALGNGLWRLTLRCGFMDRPDVCAALERAAPAGLVLDPLHVSYFLSRETLVPGAAGKGALPPWRARLFAALARNAGSVTDFFNIPPNCVVELGTRVVV